MALKLVYKAYYGTFADYNSSPNKALLFFTSITNNIESVQVLNEPVLDWEVSKAGSITFKLPPCNAGYSAIKCKKKHIFIERNGELIWHGRAISDSLDIDLNREIVCEGALNYLLDTHVKPLEIFTKYKYASSEYDPNSAFGIFDELIRLHNKSLEAEETLILSPSAWKTFQNDGSITISGNGLELGFASSAPTSNRLGVMSSPSIWKYGPNVGRKVRISFHLDKYGTGAGTLRCGLHIRDNAVATVLSAHAYWNKYVTETGDYEFTTVLGATGLDGTGHEDAYIGLHMYLNNADSGVSVHIKNLKAEFYNDDFDSEEKSFAPRNGLRTGIDRIPFHDTSNAKDVDIRDYPTTFDAINSIFLEPYGGYLFIDYRLRHPRLNYTYGIASKDEPSLDIPIIRTGINLISCKKSRNYENFPTVFIPLGAQKEDWQRSVPAPNITFTSGKKLDKDGKIVSSSDSKHYVAELSVKKGEYYFITGEAIDDSGLYSIVNASDDVIENRTFSADDGVIYEHEQIEIPDKASKLRVFFNNSTGVAIADSIFSILKYVETDAEDYITLEGYANPNRTDSLKGSKYYPLDDDLSSIYEYGWVEEIVHFDDVADQEVLDSYIGWYTTFYKENQISYEIEAAELAPVTDDPDYIPLGMPGSYAKVVVPHMNIDEVLCVTKCSINLRNFAKSAYSLANLPPADLSDLVARGLYI